jgi:hypothetical protein
MPKLIINGDGNEKCGCVKGEKLVNNTCENGYIQFDL